MNPLPTRSKRGSSVAAVDGDEVGEIDRGTPPQRRWNAVSAGATVGHAITLAVAAVLLPWFNRNQWFFGDEWEFFVNRMSGWGRPLFAPHNEHWSTVPVLLYRALYAAFGLREYLPYVLVLVALHLAAVHFVWRLMIRSGVAPIIASGLAAIFALLGAGAENLLWAFQIGFVGSVACGLMQVLLGDHTGPFGRRDQLAWGVAVLGLMCSGMGVTMTATAGLVVLFRRGARDALKVVSLPAASYLLWLAAIGSEGLGSHSRDVGSLLQVPAYIWTGLSVALERSSGMPQAGAALMLVVGVWLVRQRVVLATEAAIPTGMALGSVVMFLIAAVGRSGLGVEQSTSGRYSYVAAALLLPAVGKMLTEISNGTLSRELAVSGVLGLVLVHNVAALRTASHDEANRESLIRRQVLAAADLVGSGAPLVATQPEPAFSPDIVDSSLRRFLQEDSLPRDVGIGEADILAAATQLQVALSPGPPSGVGGEPPALVGGGVVQSGCTQVSPNSPVDIEFASPHAISLHAVAGGPLTITLRSTGTSVSGPPRTLSLAPAMTQWLSVSRITTTSLTAQSTVEICGIKAG